MGGRGRTEAWTCAGGSVALFLMRTGVVAEEEAVRVTQCSGAIDNMGSSDSTLQVKSNWAHFHSEKREGAVKSVRTANVQTVSQIEQVLSMDIIEEGCLYVRDHIPGMRGVLFRNC